ncbi:MAG: methionine adenosyltransferase [Bacilli bacterium]|nr:methionine adenosyltransferase [Bacilli bacterium]
MEKGKVFTSEAVSEGHPDKVCDQISDAILTECLKQDKNSHVACEVLISSNNLVIAGEISTSAKVNYEEVARKVLKDIGYSNASDGFDFENAKIDVIIKEQSSDINNAVSNGVDQGAGDQGIIFGYACNETKNYMPLTIEIAQEILKLAALKRKSGEFKWAKPDMKSQVSIEYGDEKEKNKVDTVVVSVQHDANFNEDEFKKYIKEEIVEVVLANYDLDTSNYTLLINPSGRFVIGGPLGDVGLTGRKIIVDTYGGRGHHGGGAFSGKDPSKVDRSAAYYCRYVAKNIVASGLAKECEIQVSYAIGKSELVSLNVFTYGTGVFDDERLIEMVKKVFDFRPYSMIKNLNMLELDYYSVSKYGHFGRSDLDLSYERLDAVEKINKYFNI